MIAFIADFVPPGTAYEDEPSLTVPVGWHVRLDGLTADQRDSERWCDHWWPTVYLGPDAVDHVRAVLLAKVANDEWEHRGRAPECVDESLWLATRELMGDGDDG